MENKIIEKQNYFKSIHPFPARMAPSIALAELSLKKKLRVLDPMAGSGTTIVAARLKGHKAIGFDLDPLAVLISSVWCGDINPETVISISEKAVKRASLMARKIVAKKAYPVYADIETRVFINFWFDIKARKQLAALSNIIAEVRSKSLQSILWCAFSKLIITKEKGASLAMDVSHSRPHKVYSRAPIMPLDRFMINIKSILKSAPFTNSNLPPAQVLLGDARRLPINRNSIDLVVTSPPYLNAIDYLRGHKLALVWMGYKIGELRKIRSHNIGTEALQLVNPSKDSQVIIKKMGNVDALTLRNRRMIEKYVNEMDLVMSEIARVLKPGGRAVIVIGNSTIRGIYIKNSEAIIALGKKNKLHLEGLISREISEQRRYLPAPTFNNSGKALQKRMREEVIITLRK